MNKLLSVITINYNNSEGLERTINSVINQNFKNFEYLVIDGGSSDNSLNVITNNKLNIDYYVSEKDKGIYNAMNKGILAANSDYILFLNSGDVFYSNKSLGYFESYLNQKKIDIVYGNLNVVDKGSWIKKYPKNLNFRYLLRDTLPHMSTIMRKDCFDGFLYDEDLKIVSDWKFFIIGVLKKKFTYQYIDYVISNFYLDGISSTNMELSNSERKQVIQEYFYFKLKLLTVIRYILKLKRNLLGKNN